MQAQGKQGESRSGILAKRGWWDMGAFFSKHYQKRQNKRAQHNVSMRPLSSRLTLSSGLAEDLSASFLGIVKAGTVTLHLPHVPATAPPTKAPWQKTTEQQKLIYAKSVPTVARPILQIHRWSPEVQVTRPR